MKSFNKDKSKAKFINVIKLFSIGLSTLAVGFSYTQKPVSSQVCYSQTEEGSTLDLSYLCQEKPTPRTTTPFTLLPADKQRAILERLSTEVSKACGQMSGRCESDRELTDVIKKVCSRPDSCPDYINEGLRNYPKQ